MSLTLDLKGLLSFLGHPGVLWPPQVMSGARFLAFARLLGVSASCLGAFPKPSCRVVSIHVLGALFYKEALTVLRGGHQETTLKGEQSFFFFF